MDRLDWVTFLGSDIDPEADLDLDVDGMTVERLEAIFDWILSSIIRDIASAASQALALSDEQLQNFQSNLLWHITTLAWAPERPPDQRRQLIEDYAGFVLQVGREGAGRKPVQHFLLFAWNNFFDARDGQGPQPHHAPIERVVRRCIERQLGEDDPDLRSSAEWGRYYLDNPTWVDLRSEGGPLEKWRLTD